MNSLPYINFSDCEIGSSYDGEDVSVVVLGCDAVWAYR
jgi:hypothetical protein